jgi:hypothetical protein
LTSQSAESLQVTTLPSPSSSLQLAESEHAALEPAPALTSHFVDDAQ